MTELDDNDGVQGTLRKLAVPAAVSAAGAAAGLLLTNRKRLKEAMPDFDIGDLGPEDPTSYPAPGELLLYPGGVSEVEILFPYGDTCFASKAGQLAGNHFATVVGGLEHLPAIGEIVLWQGAQEIRFSETA